MAEISTIQKLWIISPLELRNKYQNANQRAVDALQAYGSSQVIVDDNGGLIYPSDYANVTARQGRVPKHLSIKEELLLRKFYEGKIQEICEAFQFPHVVQATSIMFFKKFYQKWSVMEHEPKRIALVCAYLGSRVEDLHTTPEEFGACQQIDPEILNDYEYLVLESVDYNLMVYTPFFAIRGFVYLLESFVQGTTFTKEQTSKELLKLATSQADKMMLTSAPLHYPAGQLALAALRMVNKDEPKVDFERFLQTLPNEDRYLELIANLDAIEQLVRVEGEEPSKTKLRHIDLKLRRCLTPKRPHLCQI